MKRDLYAEVSTRIIAELEAGAAPWVKPWSATAGQNVPQNAMTNRPYSGCNVILLWLARNRGWLTPRFLTFSIALNQPEVMISGAPEKFDAEGNLHHEPTRELIRKQLAALVDWTHRISPAK